MIKLKIRLDNNKKAEVKSQIFAFIHSVSAAQSLMLGDSNLTDPTTDCNLFHTREGRSPFLWTQTLNASSCPGHFLIHAQGLTGLLPSICSTLQLLGCLTSLFFPSGHSSQLGVLLPRILNAFFSS